MKFTIAFATILVSSAFATSNQSWFGYVSYRTVDACKARQQATAAHLSLRAGAGLDGNPYNCLLDRGLTLDSRSLPTSNMVPSLVPNARYAIFTRHDRTTDCSSKFNQALMAIADGSCQSLGDVSVKVLEQQGVFRIETFNGNDCQFTHDFPQAYPAVADTYTVGCCKSVEGINSSTKLETVVTVGNDGSGTILDGKIVGI